MKKSQNTTLEIKHMNAKFIWYNKWICYFMTRLSAIRFIPQVFISKRIKCWLLKKSDTEKRWVYLSRDMTKPTKWHVRPAKTQISLGIRPVWSESSLSAWRKLGSLATHWAHSEDSNQSGLMPRLIWVFAGRKVTFLVLSCRGSSKCRIRFEVLKRED